MKTLRRLVPILEWLPRYQGAWLRPDAMAGLAVWAMVVPQSMAYAGVAGMPPVYGLYSVPLVMAGYALFGSSRTLSVGPASGVAMVSAATVGSMAAGNPAEFLALTSLMALLVGGLLVALGLLRVGWVANFLSQPVLQGFTQGIALVVIAGQLPKLLGTANVVAETTERLRNVPQMIGLEIDHTGFLLKMWAVIKTLGEASLATTAVGLASIALLLVFKKAWPKAPSALVAVLLAVITVSALSLNEHGVSVVGEVATGMITPTLPAISLDMVTALLPGAFAIVLLGYSVSLSIAAVGAETTGEDVDSNQELIGLGAANLGSAISAGFVVSGSLARGVVIRRAGGRTQVVSLVTAALVVLTLLFALPLFFRLPDATLAAIVIVSISGVLDFAYFRRLLQIDRGEFAYGVTALFGVLALGILPGMGFGVVLSLVVLIRQVSRPKVAILGRIPATGDYRDLDMYPEAETIPGLLVFRFDAPILFPNAKYFAAQVQRVIAIAQTPVREVMVAAHQINRLDSSGADRIAKLEARLGGTGVTISFAGAKTDLRSAMRRTGLEERIGADRIHPSIEAGCKAFLDRSR